MKKRIKLSHGGMLCLSAVLSFLFFLFLFGIKCLDVTNTAWIYNTYNDSIVHYLGWTYFRKSNWSFPLGLMSGMTDPSPISVVYADSIPLFAVFFKLFQPILPKKFQYLGLFSLVAFMLQGVLGCELTFRLTDKKKESLLASGFFLTSSVMFQRFFEHTSLSFHALILMSMLLFFDKRERPKRMLLKWILLLCLAVMIHIYFIPIIFAFEVFYYLKETAQKDWYKAVLGLFLSVGITFALMYANGCFYGKVNMDMQGFGAYNASWDALINSGGRSILHGLLGRDASSFVLLEGYAYLGMGIFLLGLVMLVDVFCKNKDLELDRGGICVAVLAIVFFAVSTIPVIRWGKKTLFTIPLPSVLEKLFSIFRANGRFIWPLFYMIILGLCVYMIRAVPRYAKYILLGCLLVQLIDVYPILNQKSEQISSLCKKPYVCQYDLSVLSDKKNIYFMDYPSTKKTFAAMLQLGIFASENNMNMNDFYLARKSDEQIEETRVLLWKTLSSATPDADGIYAFMGGIPVSSLIYRTGLNYYKDGSLLFGTQNDLKNVEALNIEEGVDLLTINMFYLLDRETDSVKICSEKPENGVEIQPGVTLMEKTELPKGEYLLLVDGTGIENLVGYSSSEKIQMELVEKQDDKMFYVITVSESDSNVQIGFVNEGEDSLVVRELLFSGEKKELSAEDDGNMICSQLNLVEELSR